jgi:hypothetical protein
VPTLISALPALTSQFPTLPAHADGVQLRSNLEKVLADRTLADRLISSCAARLEWADVRRHDSVFYEEINRLLGRPIFSHRLAA